MSEPKWEVLGLEEGDISELGDVLKGWSIHPRIISFIRRLEGAQVLTTEDDGRTDGRGRIMWDDGGGYKIGISAPLGTIVIVLPKEE